MTESERQTLVADLEALIARTPDGPARFVLSVLNLCTKTGLEEDMARALLPASKELVEAAERIVGGRRNGDGS